MNTISVILPVHELNETTKPLFGNAVKSVAAQIEQPTELVIVVPKDSEVSDYIKKFDFESLSSIISIVENDGATDFQSQVNLGVKKAKSEWVSILELDDEYSSVWFKNFNIYAKAYPNVNIFLPIIIDVDKNNSFIGFTNEAVWANGFSDEIGVLDLNALTAYQNFNIDGFVARKSIFEDFGGFKSNIKLTFVYEFLLRMAFKDVKIMVIPKFGYKHINLREGSLFATYRESLDPVEAKWWLNQAKKQYYFDNDREITYEAQTA